MCMKYNFFVDFSVNTHSLKQSFMMHTNGIRPNNYAPAHPEHCETITN